MIRRPFVRTLAAMTLALLPAERLGAEEAPLKVYVFAGDSSGFVQPDAKDSARDLTGALRSKRSLRVVMVREDADVCVRVDKRFTRDSGSAIATGSGPVVAAAAVEEQVVVATLIVGDYSTEVVGIDWWSWKSAAGKLAGNIDKWLKENKQQIRARTAGDENSKKQ
jgi:hypothetical protein